MALNIPSSSTSLNNSFTPVNANKTILTGHKSPISLLEINGNYAATADSKGVLKYWNLEKGICEWTIHPNPEVKWKILYLTNKELVALGTEATQDPFVRKPTLRIIDCLSSKEITCLVNPALTGEICVISQTLFASLKKGDIGKWSLSGEPLATIPSDAPSDPTSLSFLLGTPNFLVRAFENIVQIHELVRGDKKKVTLSFEKEKHPEISSAYMEGARLVCGFEYRKRTVPDICIIDLEKGDVLQTYQATDAFLHVRKGDDLSYITEAGEINKIILKNNKVYLAHSTGTLIIVDLSKNTHKIIGVHNGVINSLYLTETLLISASFSSGEIHFWDPDSLKKIGAIMIPHLSALAAKKAPKIVATTGTSLVQVNDPPSDKEEILTKTSPPEGVEEAPIDPCQIQ